MTAGDRSLVWETARARYGGRALREMVAEADAVLARIQPGAAARGRGEPDLHCPDPARLAYTGPDGYPRVIPIGFLWNGTGVVLCTAPSAPKVAALAQQPHLALTIDTMGPPARELLLRGTATIEVLDGARPEAPVRRHAPAASEPHRLATRWPPVGKLCRPPLCLALGTAALAARAYLLA